MRKSSQQADIVQPPRMEVESELALPGPDRSLPIFTGPLDSVCAVQGESAKFVCQVSHASYEVQWFRNTVMFGYNDHLKRL